MLAARRRLPSAANATPRQTILELMRKIGWQCTTVWHRGAIWSGKVYSGAYNRQPPLLRHWLCFKLAAPSPCSVLDVFSGHRQTRLAMPPRGPAWYQKRGWMWPKATQPFSCERCNFIRERARPSILFNLDSQPIIRFHEWFQTTRIMVGARVPWPTRSESYWWICHWVCNGFNYATTKTRLQRRFGEKMHTLTDNQF